MWDRSLSQATTCMRSHSLAGYGLSITVAGLLILFMDVYNAVGTPLLRTAVWLAYKIVCFGIIRVWAKVTCYAMRDDVRSLLLLFMMVVALWILFSHYRPFVYPICVYVNMVLCMHHHFKYENTAACSRCIWSTDTKVWPMMLDAMSRDAWRHDALCDNARRHDAWRHTWCMMRWCLTQGNDACCLMW